MKSLLDEWGHPEVGWTAAQIVSELASNCALHARTEYTITLTADDDEVRLEVRDGSPVVPRQRSYGATSTTGRGLQLVEQMAREWGVTRAATGKAVWVLLPLRSTVDGPEDNDVVELDGPTATVIELPMSHLDSNEGVTDLAA